MAIHLCGDFSILLTIIRFFPAPVTRELAAVVHVSDRDLLVCLGRGGVRGNIWWRPELKRFEDANGVRFKDGALEEVTLTRKKRGSYTLRWYNHVLKAFLTRGEWERKVPLYHG